MTEWPTEHRINEIKRVMNNGNQFWELGCGDHQNYIEDCLDYIDRLQQRIAELEDATEVLASDADVIDARREAAMAILREAREKAFVEDTGSTDVVLLSTIERICREHGAT